MKNTQRSTAKSLKAKRSLAAHKANWTRALRRSQAKAGGQLAAPKPGEGGKPDSRPLADRKTLLPAMSVYKSDQLDCELLARAIRRSETAIAAADLALAQMRAKQVARRTELSNRILSAVKKGGAA